MQVYGLGSSSWIVIWLEAKLSYTLLVNTPFATGLH